MIVSLLGLVQTLMVNLEVRWLGVVVSPGRKVIIALGRTTVGLDLDTSDLARSQESFQGLVAPQVVRWFRPWARSGSHGCTRASGADPGRRAGCCSNPRGRKRHSLCPCWDPGTLGSSPDPPVQRHMLCLRIPPGLLQSHFV